MISNNSFSLDEKLDQSYLKIGECETEIGDLVTSIKALRYSLNSMDELVDYIPIRRGVSSQEGVALAAAVPGAGIGFVTGGIASGSFLLAVGTSALGGALVFGAIAVTAYIKNNWFDPVDIEYKDLPFVNAQPNYSGGTFKVTESNPSAGIYKAKFYPNVSNADVYVNFSVRRKDLPINKTKITELTAEITDTKKMLKAKRKELQLLINEKNIIFQEKVKKDAAQKNRPKLFQSPSCIPDQTTTTSQTKVFQPGTP
jgi:hypothetical protein